MRSNLASEKTTDKWASRSEVKVLLSEDNFSAFLWQGLQCCLALLRSSLEKRSARSGYYTRTEKKEQNTKQTSGKLVFLFLPSQLKLSKLTYSQTNPKFLLRLVTLFHWLVVQQAVSLHHFLGELRWTVHWTGRWEMKGPHPRWLWILLVSRMNTSTCAPWFAGLWNGRKQSEWKSTVSTLVNIWFSLHFALR